MAKTTYYSDIINLVKRFIPSSVEADAIAFICNSAIYEIWKHYDWRESISTLPPFYLIPGAQDHGAPAVIVPADFYGLRTAQLVQLNSTPAWRRDLMCLKDLQPCSIYALPSDIDYVPNKQCFRLYPRVPMNIGAPLWCIQGTYKRYPTKVTADILASTFLPFDDVYLPNMVEVFKWAAFKFSGDPRQGGMQAVKGGGVQLTGQYAIMYDAINEMARAESLEQGDPTIAPAEPLFVTSRGWLWGPYGAIIR